MTTHQRAQVIRERLKSLSGPRKMLDEAGEVAFVETELRKQHNATLAAVLRHLVHVDNVAYANVGDAIRSLRVKP